jgi:nucleoside 2-deoxyribosyltransferase
MKVNYSDQKITKGNKSIFLAGPTPRDPNVASWRPRALKILKELGFNGIVYIPEHEVGTKYDYIDQVSWEREALHSADVVLFWVPREIKTMPAFTTNTEFGYFMAKAPETVAYGRPDDAPRNRYHDWLYKLESGKIPSNTLTDTLNEAVELASKL